MKHEHINALVSAREAKEKADAAYQEYLDTHEEFKAVEEERKSANKAVKEAEGTVRDYYGSMLVSDGKDSLPVGIGVRYLKEAIFDNRDAYDWAIEHGHLFLDLSHYRIEKALIAGLFEEDRTRTMFPYRVNDKPTITIAKELKAVEDE